MKFHFYQFRERFEDPPKRRLINEIVLVEEKMLRNSEISLHLGCNNNSNQNTNL